MKEEPVLLIEKVPLSTTPKTITIPDISGFKFIYIMTENFSNVIPVKIFKAKQKHYMLMNSQLPSNLVTQCVITQYASNTEIVVQLNTSSTNKTLSIYGFN